LFTCVLIATLSLQAQTVSSTSTGNPDVNARRPYLSEAGTLEAVKASGALLYKADNFSSLRMAETATDDTGATPTTKSESQNR
jgi:hypothetical protein